MKLTLALEYRFLRAPDGSVWTSSAYPREYFQRYLDVFDRVMIVARLESIKRPEEGHRRCDGGPVAFREFPYYLGPLEFIHRAPRIMSFLRSPFERDSAVILRAPGPISSLLSARAAWAGRPFGLEVVGDPYEVLAPELSDVMGRPLYRTFLTRSLKWQCRNAHAVAYVTERALQKRYPARGSTSAFSDVELDPEAIAVSHRIFSVASVDPSRHNPVSRGHAASVVTIASLAQRYKGVDTLLRALQLARHRMPALRLRVIGDGKYRAELEALARSLNIHESVTFIGELPAGDSVRNELDRSDLFVLASRTEGLPRSLIEAMARGLPCIATDVGGTPELLGPEALVPRDRPVALADLMVSVLESPGRMTTMSERNLLKAREYADLAIAGKRRQFYTEVAHGTQERLRRS